MDHTEGAGLQRADRVDFDSRVRLEFRGAQLSSDGGLLVMRELDDALGAKIKLVRRKKSGDLGVKRQATWGMSGSAGRVFLVDRSDWSDIINWKAEPCH